ncbi:hypothetical protein LshimejAT787_0100260 [Lyophyllum shimeji]|uniref:Uncharacterized protein n=1 Tax=Lyophyllum shimeji TaxID=47721 RepID=A0A9P3PCA9_LYOSH|nr:hypothetical protein LshimejAT787_0100260 [Lyophyllum shimeji]
MSLAPSLRLLRIVNVCGLVPFVGIWPGSFILSLLRNFPKTAPTESENLWQTSPWLFTCIPRSRARKKTKRRGCLEDSVGDDVPGASVTGLAYSVESSTCLNALSKAGDERVFNMEWATHERTGKSCTSTPSSKGSNRCQVLIIYRTLVTNTFRQSIWFGPLLRLGKMCRRDLPSASFHIATGRNLSARKLAPVATSAFCYSMAWHAGSGKCLFVILTPHNTPYNSSTIGLVYLRVPCLSSRALHSLRLS